MRRLVATLLAFPTAWVVTPQAAGALITPPGLSARSSTPSSSQLVSASLWAWCRGVRPR